jgi:putative DNA primase/helicase
MKVGEFLSRLEGVRKRSGEWEAKCPAHKDHKPSLSVKLGDGGRILVICFAGCSLGRIVASMGLSLSDLFDGPAAKGRGPSVVATYDYFDERGGLMYQVRRTADKEFPVYHQDGGRWVAGLNGQRRVLYRLPELVRAQASDYVFIVEGEKDVENLRKLGLVATCNPGGAGKGKWRAEYNDSLRKRHVVILPDNDDAGRAHAQMIAGALAPAASSVRVVELPGLPRKGDVSDWIAAGGTRDDLLKLVRAVAAGGDGLTVGFYDSLHDLFSANPAPHGPSILFGIRRGQVGSLLASANVGKTTLLLNTCLSLAAGLRCDPLVPAEPEPMRVMFVDFESTGGELREDLRVMLGNLPEGKREPAMRNFKPVVDATVDGEPLSLNVPSHMEFIEAHARRNQADLIVVDPVSRGFDAGDEDSNAEATKRVMKALAGMARRLNTAIIFAHRGKPDEGRAQEGAAYCGRGASAYAALSRAVFTLTRDAAGGEGWVILKCVKVKGRPFDPVTLRLDRRRRWFSVWSAPPAFEDDFVTAQDVADYACMRYHDETRTRLVPTEEIAAFS